MAKIAILGFGTVGSGVYEVLCHNAASVSRRAGEPVEVKYILDPKDFTGNPVEPLVVKNIDVILQDPEIRVVVETIGGTRFAYPYVKACLESGRSVCTSNKEMVATYGAELLALAKEHDCAFLFEASVGGGTPIITPMHQCLAANVITEVAEVYDVNASIYVIRRAFLVDNPDPILWHSKFGVSVMMDTGIIDIDSEHDYLLMEAIAQHLYAHYPEFNAVRENIRG